jgi:peroxin-5
MLGKCHAESDEDKKAILALQRAVDCDPYNLESLLALGTSYVNELDSVKALTTLKAWVKHNPAFSGFEAKADAYSDGSLMDEVTQLMLAAADHSPQSADVHVVLGVLYNLSLDFSSAADHLNRALVLRAGGGYADKNKLGATLANANRSAEAVPLYVEALSLRPTFARGWLNLGISFANLNRYSDAAKAYVQALHLNPQAGHIWGYLRVVLTCLERLDLVERCGAVNRVSLETSRQATSAMAAALGLDLINEPSAPPA